MIKSEVNEVLLVFLVKFYMSKLGKNNICVNIYVMLLLEVKCWFIINLLCVYNNNVLVL